jgi:class 3 adenylate cyclase
MATFSDYLVSKEDHDEMCCLLGIYSSCMLYDAFDKLLKRMENRPEFKDFLMEWNDVLNIKLGIGIAFGKVSFDYFGSNELSNKESSNLIGGYIEYTAIGNNVNTAQRLEGLASKAISQVTCNDRAAIRSEDSLISPIILSRTVILRILGTLRSITKSSLTVESQYRSTFSLKGKGTAVDAFEMKPEDINGDYIINFLKDHANTRIYTTVEKTWKNGKFNFDDKIVDELAKRYFQF